MLPRHAGHMSGTCMGWHEVTWGSSLVQHGFSEDNLKELLFAVLQMVRQNETATVKYGEVVEQIFQEFLALLDISDIEAEEEVSWLWKLIESKHLFQMCVLCVQLFGVVLEILNGLQTWPQWVLKQTGSR